MKPFIKVFLIIFFVSCNNEAERETIRNSADSLAKNNARQKSMKGFDLYAWRKGEYIFFTLLPGTNRNKTSEEIYDIKNAVPGLSAIEKKISTIDSGEYVFLKPIDIDTSDLKSLIEYMKSKNLNVTVIPQR